MISGGRCLKSGFVRVCPLGLQVSLYISGCLLLRPWSLPVHGLLRSFSTLSLRFSTSSTTEALQRNRPEQTEGTGRAFSQPWSAGDAEGLALGNRRQARVLREGQGCSQRIVGKPGWLSSIKGSVEMSDHANTMPVLGYIDMDSPTTKSSG